MGQARLGDKAESSYERLLAELRSINDRLDQKNKLLEQRVDLLRQEVEMLTQEVEQMGGEQANDPPDDWLEWQILLVILWLAWVIIWTATMGALVWAGVSS